MSNAPVAALKRVQSAGTAQYGIRRDPELQPGGHSRPHTAGTTQKSRAAAKNRYVQSLVENDENAIPGDKPFSRGILNAHRTREYRLGKARGKTSPPPPPVKETINDPKASDKGIQGTRQFYSFAKRSYVGAENVGAAQPSRDITRRAVARNLPETDKTAVRKPTRPAVTATATKPRPASPALKMVDMVKTSLSSRDKTDDHRMQRSLQCVVSVLHQVLRENARYEDAPRSTLTVPEADVATLFDTAPAAPTSRSMLSMLYSIGYRIRFRPEMGVAMLVYIDRLIEKTGLVFCSHTWKRVSFVGMMLAQKAWEDSCYDNKDYAKTMRGTTVQLVNNMERQFLTGVGHDISVKSAMYTRYSKHLTTLHEGVWFLGNEEHHGVPPEGTLTQEVKEVART